MKSIANFRVWLGVLGVAFGMALASGCATTGTSPAAQALVDRQEILNLVTRYYYNFGRGTQENQADYYAEDGVLILGTRRYEGRAGIMQAYGRGGAPPAAGAAAAPAAPRERTAFNVTIDNPLVIVHGDTATSEVIFTEFRQEKAGDPMKMTTQGKEYATFVKVNGKWLYKTRQIASGSVPPEGWKE